LTWLLRNKLAVGVAGAFVAALIGWLIALGLFSKPPNVSGTWTVKYGQLNEVDALTLTEQSDGAIVGEVADTSSTDSMPITGRITKDGQITITATGDGTAIWSGTLKGNEIMGTFNAPYTPSQTFEANRS
jgi:hypothetical protein